MTKRINARYHQRPRRMIGEQLRGWLRCPLCRSNLRVVGPYREHVQRRRIAIGLTVRFECTVCELRWSTRVEDVARARQKALLKDMESMKGLDDLLAEFAEYLRIAREVEVLASVRPSDPIEKRLAKAAAHQREVEQAVELKRLLEGE